MYQIFFIQSITDEHLGCCHVFDIVNSAVVNIGVHVFLWQNVYIPLSIYPVMGLWVEGLWGIATVFSTVVELIYTPTSSV